MNTWATASLANIRLDRFWLAIGAESERWSISSTLLIHWQIPWVAVGQPDGVEPAEQSTSISGSGMFEGMLGSRCSRQTESLRHFHQICKGVGSHFFHHLASVRLHRDLTDSQSATDLLVQKPCDY